MWVKGWKVKGQGYRVSKCIFHSVNYYAYVNAHLTDNSNTTWVCTPWVPSGSLKLSMPFLLTINSLNRTVYIGEALWGIYAS